MSDLENFVNQPGRDRLVKDVRKKIEDLGITLSLIHISEPTRPY